MASLLAWASGLAEWPANPGCFQFLTLRTAALTAGSQPTINHNGGNRSDAVLLDLVVAAEALLPIGWRVRREQARDAEALHVPIDASGLVRHGRRA